MPAPPNPEMRSRRKGCHLCTGEVRQVPHSENATARRQVQYVGKLSTLPQAETALAAAFARALARREGVQR
jgi:hypothetical protein